MSARRCRSRSKFGNCGLPFRHEGAHAVPIMVGWKNDPHDWWFAYTRRSHDRLGYVLVPSGTWVAL